MDFIGYSRRWMPWNTRGPLTIEMWNETEENYLDIIRCARTFMMDKIRCARCSITRR